MKKLSLFKFGDLIIVFAALAVVIYFLFSLFVPTDDSLAVEITKNGQVVFSKELSNITETESYTVEGDIPVVVELYSDGAAVIDSKCSDKICIDTGKLTKSGDVAVCLPARVVVSLEGMKSNDTPDIVIG